jgi:hypothetical protein
MTLDDNHDSVVLSCAKVINVMLSCEFNETYFDFSEVNFAFCIPVYFSHCRPKFYLVDLLPAESNISGERYLHISSVP